MKQLLPLLILINCHMIQVSGVLEWIVIGKVTDYGQDATLFCNVSNCCPKDSGWDRYSPEQRTLFIDVKSGRSNKKYDGKTLRDGYTLVIKNLTKNDLNVSYSCVYGVTIGQSKFLLEEDVFIYISNTTPNVPHGNSRLSGIQIAGIVIGIVGLVTVSVVFFVLYSRRNGNHRKRVQHFEEELLLDMEEQKSDEVKTASLRQNAPQPEKGSKFSSCGKIFKPRKWKRKKRSEKIEKTAVEKDKHEPSYIKKSDDSTTSPAERSLKSSEKSEKKKAHPKEDTTQKYTQSVVKDQEHHEHHDLTGYYDELLDNTILDKMVLDNLISRCILMIEDTDEIVKPTTQRERNRVLLDILTERPYPTFQLFKDVLQESDPSKSVQELVKRMRSTESRDEHINWQGHEIEATK